MHAELIGQRLAADSLPGLLHDDDNAVLLHNKIGSRRPIGITWSPGFRLDIVKLGA